MIRGVLLDVDGTLVDSNDAHARAIVEALEACGLQASFDKVRSLIGMGSDKLLEAAAGLKEDDPRAEQVGDRKKEIFQERYLPGLRPFPHTRELLQRLRERGLPLVAASIRSSASAIRRSFPNSSSLAELAATSASEVEESKPEPDIIEAALRKIGLPPGEVLLLGDTPYDIEAARKAGVGTVALRCGGWSDEDLAGAVAIYQDPADLLARFDESPFAS